MWEHKFAVSGLEGDDRVNEDLAAIPAGEEIQLL